MSTCSGKRNMKIRVNRCCCGFPLDIGCVFIAVFFMGRGTFMLMYFYVLYVKYHNLEEDELLTGDLKYIIITETVAAILSIVMAFILLIGTIMRVRAMLLMWIVYSCVFLLVRLGLTIVRVYFYLQDDEKWDKYFTVLFINTLTILFWMYCLLIVYSLHWLHKHPPRSVIINPNPMLLPILIIQQEGRRPGEQLQMPEIT